MCAESNPPSNTDSPRPEPISNSRSGPVRFSHPAEQAFANILDFYMIEWQYEPTTFPLGWDEEGRVTAAFTPDFYLVEDNLYIELTTMQQRHVTTKNRKLRLLRELYPDVKCKLMYRKDIENLAVKYRLFEDGPLPKLGPAAESGDAVEGSDETEARK
jgi:hypothetical protein